jgi:hypothetical protein
MATVPSTVHWPPRGPQNNRLRHTGPSERDTDLETAPNMTGEHFNLEKRPFSSLRESLSQSVERWPGGSYL